MNKKKLKFEIILPTLLLTLSLSCGMFSDSDNTSRENQNSLSIIIVSSDISKGLTPIKFAVLNLNGNPILDKEKTLKGLVSPLESPELEKPFTIEWESWPVSGGVYKTKIDFQTSGYWKIIISYEEPENLLGEAIFDVKEKPQTPEIGIIPLRIHTKTFLDKSLIDNISSDPNPNLNMYKFDFYDVLGIKPIVINFSTPSFCKSGTCSPVLQYIKTLSEEFSNDVIFIHVEIYDNPHEIKESGNLNIGKISDPVKQWNLPSEPWTFLIDISGKIASKHESFIDYEELRQRTYKLTQPNQ